jgi:hypothetical protein
MTSAIRVLVLALLSLMPFRVEAQNSSPPPQTHNQQLLKSEEVDALVAPTLLYPEAFREASVPEVVEDGVTGYMVDSLEEAVSKVDSVISLGRTRVRRRFEQRFTAERMAPDYLRIYAALIGARRDIGKEHREIPCFSDSWLGRLAPNGLSPGHEALLLALTKIPEMSFPDFSSLLGRIAGSIEKMADANLRRPVQGPTQDPDPPVRERKGEPCLS